MSTSFSSFPPAPRDVVSKRRSSLRFASELRSQGTRGDKAGISVLVVEDDLKECRLIEACLFDDFRQVFVAHSIEEAKEFLHHHMTDVVIMDMGLPDGDGFDCLDMIQDVAPEAATIVLSGRGGEQVALESLSRGAQDYIHKASLKYDTLASKVRYARERKNKEELLGRLAYFDQLTGLANRTALREKLTKLIRDSEDDEGHFAVLFVDLNGFKSVNDTMGHDVGDILLQRVARRFEKCVRSYDQVFRYGGDEFILLLPDVTGTHETTVMTERIHEVLERPFLISGSEIQASAAVGCAEFPAEGTTIAALLKKSDIDMYRNKS